MKKTSLLTVILLLSFAAFAQDNLTLNFCSKPAKEIKIEDLLTCKLLSVDNPEYKVESYTIGFQTGKDYKEVILKDNTISELAIDLIKKHNPTMVYIEEIVLIDKNGVKTKSAPLKVKNK